MRLPWGENGRHQAEFAFSGCGGRENPGSILPIAKPSTRGRELVNREYDEGGGETRGFKHGTEQPCAPNPSRLDQSCRAVALGIRLV